MTLKRCGTTLAMPALITEFLTPIIIPFNLKSCLNGLAVPVRKQERHCFAIGELSDVHRCLMPASLSQSTRKVHTSVVVKVLRGISLYGNDQQSFEHELTILVQMWKIFNHVNIMECYGLSTQFGPIPGFVLPYCERGSILDHLKASKDAQPLSLLLQVIKGVKYLHSRQFVHGDIRASNILIKSDGTPVLMDAGLYKVLFRASHLTTAGICKPCRWMAPEVLDPPEECDGDISNATYTNQSDVYSLGMSILEVLTGKPPFSNRRYDTVVILEVIRGVKPLRPDCPLVSDDVWNLMQSCWTSNPKCRPSVAQVEKWLRVIIYIGTTASA